MFRPDFPDWELQVHDRPTEAQMKALLGIENLHFAYLRQVREFIRDRSRLLLTASGKVIPELPDVGPDDLWGPELLEPKNRVTGTRRATIGAVLCALAPTESGGLRCTLQDLIHHVDVPDRDLLKAFLRRLRERKHADGWSYLEADISPAEPLYETFLDAQFQPVRTSPQGWIKLAWPSSAWRGKE